MALANNRQKKEKSSGKKKIPDLDFKFCHIYVVCESVVCAVLPKIIFALLPCQAREVNHLHHPTCDVNGKSRKVARKGVVLGKGVVGRGGSGRRGWE